MSVAVRTIYPNLLYQLTVVNESSNVEIIRYTLSNRLLSSSYLPASMIAILQRRWNLINAGVSTPIVEFSAALLGNVVLATDQTGSLTLQYGGTGVYNYLSFVNPDSMSTYVLNVGIPHSTGPLIVSSGAVAAPF